MDIYKETGFLPVIREEKYVDEVKIPKAKKVDFIKMANYAFHYLDCNPVASEGYQCRFWLKPMSCPPFTPDPERPHGLYDPITVGDTESRNDVAHMMLREITKTPFSVPQERVHERLLSYIRNEVEGAFPNICWNYNYCAGTPDFLASTWSTGMLLHCEVLRYRITGETESIAIARRLFEGLCAAAIHENGRAYFKAGGAAFSEEGASTSYNGTYPTVLSGLCEYYLATNDDRCMVLMKEIAEGFLYDMQPGNLHREDGGIDGHNHVQLHAVRGMAQLSFITGDPRYLKWTRDIYEFYRKWALDSAWLPEIRDQRAHSNHTETCLNADMHEIEIWLALSGCVEMWDRVDRGFRNYFAPAQFTVTQKLESLYREINAGHTPQEVKDGLNMLREFEGGFISAIMPNDMLIVVMEGDTHYGELPYHGKNVYFDMMGCCPPEGMRALYFTYRYIVHEAEKGQIYINLPFDVDTREAVVKTELPQKGLYTVTAKHSGTYYLRIPRWTQRGKVKAFRGGKEVSVIFGGGGNMYVVFHDVSPTEKLDVSYPLLEMWQDVSITPFTREPQYYSYHWIGNTIVEVTPHGEFLPLYEDEVF